MASPTTRAYYLKKRTEMVDKFCKQAEMIIVPLNNGYQLRVENLVDFYPVSGRYCILRTGERGDWDTREDLRQLMLKALPQQKPRIEYDTREFNGGLDFEPKPYQKEVLDNYRADQNVQLITGRDGRNRFVGIDHAAKGGDKTVVSQHLKGSHPDMIIFDEASNWPDYKWYRNPIKWLQFRKVMKTLERRHK